MTNNKRGLIAFICISMFLVVLDIIVVETVYRPTSDWGNIYKYHYIYWTLIIVLPIVASYKLRSLMPLATYIFFIFGLEDTLFYALQGYLPEIYCGVNVCGIWEAALNQVLIINVIGISLIVGYTILVSRVNKRLSRWVQ